MLIIAKAGWQVHRGSWHYPFHFCTLYNQCLIVFKNRTRTANRYNLNIQTNTNQFWFPSKILACKTVLPRVCACQSRPTLCDPIDCSLLCSSVHGILQARILEWVATSLVTTIQMWFTNLKRQMPELLCNLSNEITHFFPLLYKEVTQLIFSKSVFSHFDWKMRVLFCPQWSKPSSTLRWFGGIEWTSNLPLWPNYFYLIYPQSLLYFSTCSQCIKIKPVIFLNSRHLQIKKVGFQNVIRYPD